MIFAMCFLTCLVFISWPEVKNDLADYRKRVKSVRLKILLIIITFYRF